eukprot:g30098.t1
MYKQLLSGSCLSCHLGTCEKVVVEKEKAVLVTDGSHADSVKERIVQLEQLLEDTDSSYDQEKIQDGSPPSAVAWRRSRWEVPPRRR